MYQPPDPDLLDFQPEPNEELDTGEECRCGNWKPKNQDICDQCRYFDK